MSRLKIFLVMCMMLLTGLGSGCAVSRGDIHGFNLISVEDEKQLGAKFAAEIEKQATVVNDPVIQAYVDNMGKKLLAGAREVTFDYTFKVIKDDSVNAFAVPGGYVYLQTGLLKAAETEEEVAGVLAHEINHIVARHSTRQLTQQYGYSLVLQLLLGQDPGLLTQIAGSLVGKAGALAYSRGMEAQADFLAVETMHKAGYNPIGIVNFFQKLDTMNKRNPSAIAQFFSSHPLTADRIEEVKAEIAKLPPRNYTADNPAAFARVKDKLR